VKPKKKDKYILEYNPDNLSKIFKLITKKIPESIFSILDNNFFKYIISEKIIDLYAIKKNSKITSVITMITIDNYNVLKRKIILFLLAHPIIVLKNINFLIKMLNKSSIDFFKNKEKKYIHLLHLVILSQHFKKISLRKKDYIFNYFFKEILKKNNANNLFLCYEAENLKAHSYYKRNNFKIFKKINNVFFLRKSFKR
tara:strand:+ start:180 stop:773 length:594 start_codon:yes stop_codon:yes gene_type:complete